MINGHSRKRKCIEKAYNTIKINAYKLLKIITKVVPTFLIATDRAAGFLWLL